MNARYLNKEQLHLPLINKDLIIYSRNLIFEIETYIEKPPIIYKIDF